MINLNFTKDELREALQNTTGQRVVTFQPFMGYIPAYWDLSGGGSIFDTVFIGELTFSYSENSQVPVISLVNQSENKDLFIASNNYTTQSFFCYGNNVQNSKPAFFTGYIAKLV